MSQNFRQASFVTKCHHVTGNPFSDCYYDCLLLGLLLYGNTAATITIVIFAIPLSSLWYRYTIIVVAQTTTTTTTTTNATTAAAVGTTTTIVVSTKAFSPTTTTTTAAAATLCCYCYCCYIKALSVHRVVLH